MIHVIGTLVVAPYAALALGFLAIGRLAGSSDLWDLFDRMVQAAAWFMPWGALGFVTLFIVVAGLGAVADTRAIGRRALFALSVAVLGILVLYRPSAITVGEMVFLLPCATVAVACLWAEGRREVR